MNILCIFEINLCVAPLILPEKDSKEFQLFGVQFCTVACMSFLKKMKQQVKNYDIAWHVEELQFLTLFLIIVFNQFGFELA